MLRAPARDEARHSALAWRTVQWAIRERGAPVRGAVLAVLARAPREQGWHEVILPVALKLGTAA